MVEYMFNLGLTVASFTAFCVVILLLLIVVDSCVESASRKSRAAVVVVALILLLTIGVCTYPKVFVAIW